jgi:hypothetical protein
MRQAARRLLIIVALGLAVSMGWQGFDWLSRDLAFTRAKTEVGFWGRGSYQPDDATIERTGEHVDALLQARPNHPAYLGLHASYAAWRAYWAGEGEVREKFIQMATNSQYAALQSRPAHRQGWQKLLEYTARSSNGDGLRAQSISRLEALQP